LSGERLSEIHLPQTRSILGRHGLNLQAVFDLTALPVRIGALLEAEVPDLARFRQLHLFGHGGRGMWQALQASGFATARQPVDDFSADTVRRYFGEELGADYRLLFPNEAFTLPLQRLGELAGWHHDSPFRVGVNRQWGSWFAYRAVALAATDLPPTKPAGWGPACADCMAKPCIAACPAGALASGRLELDRCIDYRLQQGSECTLTCLARLTCPVGAGHRYSEAQIGHHYGRSLVSLKAWRRER